MSYGKNQLVIALEGADGVYGINLYQVVFNENGTIEEGDYIESFEYSEDSVFGSEFTDQIKKIRESGFYLVKYYDGENWYRGDNDEPLFD
jgi:hypothetical protein